MDRPKGIDSGEAMRWNADVERRRREHHERRCAENPIYRRAYERQQEMLQRMQKMQSVAVAQLANAMSEDADLRCQKAHDIMSETISTQRMKTHEEAMRERALMTDVAKYGREGIPGGGLAAAFLVGMMFTDSDKLRQRLQELEEEKPYVEEIRRADSEFDKEMIRLSGFEW